MEKLKTKLIVLLCVILPVISSAQKDDDNLKNKLAGLKGKVEKLTVKVDGKDVAFEGEDAEKLVRRLKVFYSMQDLDLFWFSDDEIDGSNLMIYKFREDDDADGESTKKIKVDIDDGKKKVTVTETKDGKEETKVYEGEEAEKFLKGNEKEGKFRMHFDGEDDGTIFFERFGYGVGNYGCHCCCDRMMKMHRGFPGVKEKKVIIKNFDEEEEAEE
ncbi:MAG: hypothetical protein HYS25_07890 [Ignavibacteriales bacterium]|nr:hypothetical protein [Ignavibacteriales bacterium]